MSGGAKRALVGVAKKLPLGLLPLDGLLRASQRVSSLMAKALLLRDWRLEAQGRPQFFKHQINLSCWIAEPARWAFAARGVYARELMFQGCRVLDLCCGDGAFSYLFFSDIAGNIDAVDKDRYALAYARRFHASSVIHYHEIDVLTEPLPSQDYDVVVWNAAICYFEENEIHSILKKIVAAGRPTMKLVGMLPKANRWVDHKTEFEDPASVVAVLDRYFESIRVRQNYEGSAVTFYFEASKPRNSQGSR